MRAGMLSVVLVLASPVWAQETVLRLRGGVEAPKGNVVGVDQAGVTVRVADKNVVLTWDRVAEVRGEHAAEAAAFAGLAEKAWRARARLERLDYVAAEPLFEELSREVAGKVGATPAVIAEGLLRCRLRRGVQTAAVGPWLAWVEAAGAGTLSPSMDVVIAPGSPPLVDSATGLCPSLPPIWMRLPSVEAFARGDGAEQAAGPDSAEPKTEDAKGATPGAQTKAERLRDLYRRAAAFECGLAGEMKPGEAPLRHPDSGVAIVAQIVAARAGTPELRREARRLLSDRLAQRQPQWLEAWLRAAIGRSLLRESDEEEHLLGVAQMLEVPARLRGASPYLAGVALASGAMQMGVTNPVAAWNLKKELMETLPGHPALDLEAMRTLRATRPGKSVPGGAGGDAKGTTSGQGAAEGTPKEAK